MNTAQNLDIAKLKRERQIVGFRGFERANSWIASERGQRTSSATKANIGSAR